LDAGAGPGDARIVVDTEGPPTSTAEVDERVLAAAAPAIDDLEREQTRASLRRKMFGRADAGVRIGRFVILRRLGAGGMGVVYAAYDAELDRRVAIKLMHADQDAAGQASSRLLAEARALARLSHPNVVQIYDVGTHARQVYVAMEYIEGQTLSEHLDVRPPPPWREILRPFLAAGRGLAAAHRVGLVHRDFKPANVLVGADGSVRVVDFGLARVAATSGAPADPSASGATSTVAGTPAYMAPEQYDGGPVDARSDQFGYCVALYEALHGERPFSGKTPLAVRRAIGSGEVRPPPRDRAVPEWLRKILRRGLSPDPAQRFPDMAALLEALERDPRRRVRRLASALGIVASVGLALGLGSWFEQRRLGACRTAADRLEGVWDPARSGRLDQALRATGSPMAEQSLPRLHSALDAHAARWVAEHTAACEATQRGEQSEAILDLRMRCLERRRQELAALTDLLLEADAPTVGRAAEAVAALTPPEQCSDIEALAAEVPPPEDPVLAAAVDEVRSTLAEAKAREDAGKYDEASIAAEAAVEAGSTLSYPPVTAEALLRRGELEAELGRHDAARASLSEAYWTALESRHDRVAARAASAMVHLLARLARFSEGHEWARHGYAIVRRIGEGGHEEAELLEGLGELLDRESRHAQAREHLERALAIQRELLRPDDPALGRLLHRLGAVAYQQSEVAHAQAYFEQALAIWDAAFGPEHPALGRALTGLGVVLKDRGRFAEARAVYERSVAIQEAAFGPEHSAVARDLNNLGNLLRHLGELDEALRLQQRALRIREAAFGPAHPAVAQSWANLGLVHAARGADREALQAQERALAIREATLGPEHREVADSLNNVGEVELRLGLPERALEHHRRADAIRRRLLEPPHPDLSFGATQIAEALVAIGSADEAVLLVETALRELEGRPDATPEILGAARFVLARALWARPADRPRALELAATARADFGRGGPELRTRVAEVEGWLRERS
jgi:tetratricopeptide (TPR) repeat protein